MTSRTRRSAVHAFPAGAVYLRTEHEEHDVARHPEQGEPAPPSLPEARQKNPENCRSTLDEPHSGQRGFGPGKRRSNSKFRPHLRHVNSNNGISHSLCTGYYLGRECQTGCRLSGECLPAGRSRFVARTRHACNPSQGPGPGGGRRSNVARRCCSPARRLSPSAYFLERFSRWCPMVAKLSANRSRSARSAPS